MNGLMLPTWGVFRRPKAMREPNLPSPPSVFFLFFLMTRPPPSSTLFPYTTLFRSRRRGLERFPLPRRAGKEGRALLQGNFEKDRKSTRLNSSHSQISYAVFCLK